MKIYLLIVLFFSSCLYSSGAEKVTGLVVEKDGEYTYEKYMRNGVEDGVYKGFHNGKLYIFGEMKNGFFSGNWYYFNENGELMIKFSRFFANDKSLTLKDLNCIPDYICYYESFYSNGQVKEEGSCLFYKEEDPLIDSYEYGKYIYYDEKGNVIKTKIFE